MSVSVAKFPGVCEADLGNNTHNFCILMDELQQRHVNQEE